MSDNKNKFNKVDSLYQNYIKLYPESRMPGVEKKLDSLRQIYYPDEKPQELPR